MTEFRYKKIMREIDCLPRTSTEAPPKHAEEEFGRPMLELVRDTKGNVTVFNWLVSSRTKTTIIWAPH